MKTVARTGTRPVLLGGIAIIAALAVIGFQGYAAAGLAASIAAAGLLAIALDLAWGYTGILSLGHGLFFGIAAYVTALASKAGIDSFLLLVVIAIGSGAALALIIGLLMFIGRTELPIIYVAMATLALAFVAEQVARSWNFVGADTGIAGLLPPDLFGLDTLDPYIYLGICLGVLLCVFVLALFLVRSDWGLVLTGIRENEQRMKFSGFRTAKAKVQVFVISGGIAGLGGFLYTFNLGVASPTILGVNQSTLAVVWVLAGGVGTLVGALVGTVVISYLSEQLSLASHGWWEIALGTILIAILIVFPKGIVGMFRLARRYLARVIRPSGTAGTTVDVPRRDAR